MSEPEEMQPGMVYFSDFYMDAHNAPTSAWAHCLRLWDILKIGDCWCTACTECVCVWEPGVLFWLWDGIVLLPSLRPWCPVIPRSLDALPFMFLLFIHPVHVGQTADCHIMPFVSLTCYCYYQIVCVLRRCVWRIVSSCPRARDCLATLLVSHNCLFYVFSS